MGRDDVRKIEEEIRQEKAEALGRAGEKLEQVLAQLRALRPDLAALDKELGAAEQVVDSGAAEQVRRRDRLLGEYDALWRKAQTYRQHLIIHREALGFQKHGDVDRLYPLPERLSRRGRGIERGPSGWTGPSGLRRGG